MTQKSYRNSPEYLLSSLNLGNHDTITAKQYQSSSGYQNESIGLNTSFNSSKNLSYLLRSNSSSSTDHCSNQLNDNHYQLTNDHYAIQKRLNLSNSDNQFSDESHLTDQSGVESFKDSYNLTKMNYFQLPGYATLNSTENYFDKFAYPEISFERCLSPSLDQGYSTLISPSSSASIPSIPSIQLKKSMLRRKQYRSGYLFDRLNDSTILNIFNWLDSIELYNIAKVCRRFEQLAWTTKLWKIINLKGEHINGDRTLKIIFKYLVEQNQPPNGICLDIERVMLSEGCRLTDKGLLLVMKRCPKLTHLQLQLCTQLSNQLLSEALAKLTNLQHLDLTGCNTISRIEKSLNLEIDSSNRLLLLQYLDLTDCTAIDDSGLSRVIRNCPQLVYLYLRRCVQLTDAGVKFIPSFCNYLKELSISGCINITDFGLYELAILGAALRYLSVAKCDQVSDAGLKVIARRCYKLRYLNARGCEAVSDDSIIFLSRSCPRLRALDIGKCDVSDAGLRSLAESCPNLKKLSLKNCDMITDNGIQCIAYYCRGLQQLNIQDCQITIEGYRAVKKYCKRCVIEHTNPGFC